MCHIETRPHAPLCCHMIGATHLLFSWAERLRMNADGRVTADAHTMHTSSWWQVKIEMDYFCKYCNNPA